MTLIDKAKLLNTIATQVHYDSEHSLEMYAKMLSLINDAPEAALTLVDANGDAVDCGRQIDADKLKEHYSWWEGGSQEMTLDEAKKTFDTVVDLQPTIDAVEVVRCKDCKWYEIEQLKRDGTDDKRYKPSVCVIGAYAEPRKADWYCADGERREDGNNDRN